MTLEELEMIAELCRKHNVIVISDEVYEWLIYPPHQHIRIGEQTVVFILFLILHFFRVFFHVKYCSHYSHSSNLAGLRRGSGHGHELMVSVLVMFGHRAFSVAGLMTISTYTTSFCSSFKTALLLLLLLLLLSPFI